MKGWDAQSPSVASIRESVVFGELFFSIGRRFLNKALVARKGFLAFLDSLFWPVSRGLDWSFTKPYPQGRSVNISVMYVLRGG